MLRFSGSRKARDPSQIKRLLQTEALDVKRVPSVGIVDLEVRDDPMKLDEPQLRTSP